MTRILRTSLALIILAGVMECQSPVNEMVRVDSHDAQLVQQGNFLFYMNKRFSGIVEETYGAGHLKRRGEYRDGLLNGTVLTWYPNGSTESVRKYKNGEKEGVHKGWWRNDQPMFEYTFASGQYHGAFKEWYQSGRPLHEFIYDNGEIVSAVGWRENGRPYINFMVKNGRKYGLTNARLCYSLKDEKGSYITSSY